jgi:hypothetical protein
MLFENEMNITKAIPMRGNGMARSKPFLLLKSFPEDLHGRELKGS